MKYTEEEYQRLIDLGYSLSEKFNEYFKQENSSVFKQEFYQMLIKNVLLFELNNDKKTQNYWRNFLKFLVESTNKDFLKNISMFPLEKRQNIANAFILPNTCEFYQEIENMESQNLSDSTIMDCISEEYQVPKKIVFLKLMEIRLSQNSYGKNITPSNLEINNQRKK